MLNAQIKELYENGDMEPIQIAEVLQLDENSVKMVLLGSSTKFRKAAKENKGLFTDDDFTQAKQKMAGLLYSEHDNVSFRAAKFILNENMGRHDIRNVQNLNINVNILNEQILNAKKAIEKGKNKIIDVPSEIAHLKE